MISQGLHDAIVVPVHLPLSRVGALSWWGKIDPDKARGLVRAHGPLLLAIAHYFVDLLGDQALPSKDARVAEPPSVRELECLTLAANGFADVEIAYEMNISFHTVRFHLLNACRRLGARNKTHAVVIAAQLGMIGKSVTCRRATSDD